MFFVLFCLLLVHKKARVTEQRELGWALCLWEIRHASRARRRKNFKV